MIARRRSVSGERVLALAVCAITFCVARSAFASEMARSPPAQTSEEQQGKARALFQQGNALLDSARYPEALECFQHAYALWANPKILLNIAATRRALGENVEAATAYVRYLETVEPNNPRREEVAQALQELSGQLGRLLSPKPQGVERLWLDDVEIAVGAGKELWVEPGEHVLVAARTDGRREVRRMTIHAAEQRRVDWTLARVSRPSLSPQAAEQPLAAGVTQPLPPTHSNLLALARADFDVTRGGAVFAGGIAFAPTQFLHITGGALIGAQKGAWLGLDYALFEGPLRPVLGASAPVFLVAGVYPGVSGELGVRFVATPSVASFVRAAVSYFPTVPNGYVNTLFVPSAGVEVGL